MNERSFIVKSDARSHLSLGKPDVVGAWKHSLRIGPRTPRYAESSGTRRSPPSPELFEMSRHGGQDFVSHAACTMCETTGTGCAAGSKPANGSGVGCPMNWKIAATTLKMHVA